MRYQFTSESVSEGHPDKLADQISDAILDAYLAVDPGAKVACETFLTYKAVIIGGEIHSSVKISKKSIEELVRQVIAETGYTNEVYGYDADTVPVHNYLNRQSAEIRSGVDQGGAGDQGMMFGYACDETEALMPLPIFLSHLIVERLAKLRKSGSIPWLLPDAKSQVTVIYDGGKPVAIDTMLVSTQHMPYVLSGGSAYQGSGHMPHGHYGGGVYYVTNEMIREAVIEKVLKPILAEYGFTDAARFIINPSGSFTVGGPAADTGLTGRKIIVDTYGGSAPHGGGAFSGKDPSKVDRSAAYAARYIAKNLVAAGLCKRVTVQISYAIGMAEPTSLFVDTHGTAIDGITDETLARVVAEVFPLKPNDIIKELGLRQPIYRETAAYGHMGRKPERVVKKFKNASGETIEREVDLFKWEQTDKTEQLKRMINLNTTSHAK